MSADIIFIIADQPCSIELKHKCMVLSYNISDVMLNCFGLFEGGLQRGMG